MSDTPGAAASPVASSASAAPAAAGGDGDFPPLPFVTVDEQDRFNVNPKAVEYLKSLPATSRVAVVAIAGVYRTGKSYLLNLLMGRNGGSGSTPQSSFVVGPTVKATTKGIWIWGKAVEVEGGAMTVIFMDTEGLGSTVRSETYDARIFALALLLSSYFIYNSANVIDGGAIAKLSYVAQLTRVIKVRASAKGEDSGSEYNQFFPSFLWVVRDFAVKLEGRDGRKISAREYLEDALKPEDGVSEAVEAKNGVRHMLRSFFPERDAVCLVRPLIDEKGLAGLAGLGPEALRPEFRAQIEALKRRVYGALRPKTLYGQPLSGSALASLAEAYVGALNAGGTPTISSAWERVVDSQCAEAVEGAIRVYKGRVKEALDAAAAGSDSPSSVAVVVEESYLHAAHAAASAAALAHFARAAVQDGDKTPPFEAQLRGALEEEGSRLRRANDAASAAACGRLLESLHEQAAAAIAAARRQQHSAQASSSGSASAAGGGGKGAAVNGSNSSAAGEGGADAAVSAAASAAVPASAVARAYRAAASALSDAYSAAAQGPAKHRVLAEYSLSRLPLLLSDASAAVDDSSAALAAAYNARVAELASFCASLRGREKAALENLAAERSSFERALSEQARTGGEAAERLKSQLAAKSEDLDRAGARYDRLLATHEAAVVRADEAAARAAAEVSAARRRVDELHTSRSTGLLETAVLATRLAEAEAARGDAERLATELRLKLGEEAKASALLLERCRAAENETVRLREQTELLYEAVRVNKDMLVKQKDEKEEVEFQWGVAKAKLAQLQSESGTLQDELAAMRSLACALKATVLANKSRIKGFALDRQDQRVFDGLDAPSG